jgi:hypothetical protein
MLDRPQKEKKIIPLIVLSVLAILLVVAVFDNEPLGEWAANQLPGVSQICHKARF